MTESEKRIAWGLTGSGHYLKESMEIIRSLNDVDLFLSKAGEEVLKWYGYNLNDLKKAASYYEKALNIDPGRKEVCEGYGDLLFKLNMHIKALEYIKKGTGFICFTKKDVRII